MKKIDDPLRGILDYSARALSRDNALNGDADTNARYVPEIRFAECGDAVHGASGFCFEVSVPRHSANPLGMSLNWIAQSREDAVIYLRALIKLIQEA